MNLLSYLNMQSAPSKAFEEWSEVDERFRERLAEKVRDDVSRQVNRGVLGEDTKTVRVAAEGDRLVVRAVSAEKAQEEDAAIHGLFDQHLRPPSVREDKDGTLRPVFRQLEAGEGDRSALSRDAKRAFTHSVRENFMDTLTEVIKERNR